MEFATTQAVRRFTAAEVERMLQVGIVGEDEPVELLEGVLEAVPPPSVDHARRLHVIEGELQAAYGPTHAVLCQKPVDAHKDSRPKPDIAVLRAPAAHYRRELPTGADTILVVEFSVNSLERDHRKARLYALAGVPVLWIVDVRGRRLEVHSDPGPEGYGALSVLGEADEVLLPETALRWTVVVLLP